MVSAQSPLLLAVILINRQQKSRDKRGYDKQHPRIGQYQLPTVRHSAHLLSVPCHPQCRAGKFPTDAPHYSEVGAFRHGQFNVMPRTIAYETLIP